MSYQKQPALQSLLLLLSFFVTICQSFVAIPLRSWRSTDYSRRRLYLSASEDTGSVTVSYDKYDVVKVDLSDDRDYPIYIGTGYEDQEGEFQKLLGRQIKKNT